MGQDAPAPITEIDLCRAWTRLPRSVPLTTTDGQSVDVIHLGTWTHGFGPDFRDAIISLDNGPAVHGSIELHLRTRGWTDHRHHLDPRYNDVILHVVGQHDHIETRRSDGKCTPTVVLDIHSLGLPTHAVDWTLVGGTVCAEQLSASQPALIREIVSRLGDERMTARAARFEASLAASTPDAVLYAEILDALGYVSNRDPMASICERMPWSVVSILGSGTQNAFAVLSMALLGAGGFLPMSDQELAHTGLSPVQVMGFADEWPAFAKSWALSPIPSTKWTLARTRPSNHPIRRLVQAAAIITGTRFHLGTHLLSPLREHADPTTTLIELVTDVGAPPLGADRARAIATNVLIPFAFAIASQNGDLALADGVASVWESMPGAESNERTRRAVHQVAGDAGMKRLGARVQQGLIHLDQTLCSPRRCFECPVAAVVVRESTRTSGPLG